MKESNYMPHFIIFLTFCKNKNYCHKTSDYLFLSQKNSKGLKKRPSITDKNS